MGKTLTRAANLANLLPTGTVLAFQALSPSFTNKGSCYPSNKYITGTLIIFCSLSCIFFSITGSIRGNKSGKIYYGIACPNGFYLFNQEEDEIYYRKEEEVKKPSQGKAEDDKRDEFSELVMQQLRLRLLDYVHSFFSVLVFLVLTFSDSDIKSCLFANPGEDMKELLVNLPLGVAVLASLVFMVFPTSRKGIGYSDVAPPKPSSPPSSPTSDATPLKPSSPPSSFTSDATPQQQSPNATPQQQSPNATLPRQSLETSVQHVSDTTELTSIIVYDS